jgi:hypothetical protein
VHPRDLAADLGQGPSNHLSASQIVDLEHAATLGDQLAAYRLGWERRGSASMIPRNASSDSLKSRRSTSGRHISIEVEPSFRDHRSQGSPQQHGMCYIGRTRRRWRD